MTKWRKLKPQTLAGTAYRLFYATNMGVLKEDVRNWLVFSATHQSAL